MHSMLCRRGHQVLHPGARLLGALLAVTGVLAGSAGAQAPPPGHGRPSHEAAGAGPSPYAGLPGVAASGLLPEEVEGLAAGQGMALALAAELNGYPGPRHVLDAADAGQLSLRPDQRHAMVGLHARMLADARATGQEILRMEAQLATRFRHGHVDEASLRQILDDLGRLRAALRFVHLRAHLDARALLTDEQLARYQAARGYGGTRGTP
jgi:hypothetical protein